MAQAKLLRSTLSVQHVLLWMGGHASGGSQRGRLPNKLVSVSFGVVTDWWQWGILRPSLIVSTHRRQNDG